jgi:hypothetical protein
MPSAPDGGPQPMQPQVFSPTANPSDNAGDPAAAAAPGFSSLPDAPADVPPAVPTDSSDPQSVPPAPVDNSGVPAPADGAAPAPGQYQDPGDVPVFPPSDDDVNDNPPAAV